MKKFDPDYPSQSRKESRIQDRVDRPERRNKSESFANSFSEFYKKLTRDIKTVCIEDFACSYWIYLSSRNNLQDW